MKLRVAKMFVPERDELLEKLRVENELVEVLRAEIARLTSGKHTLNVAGTSPETVTCGLVGEVERLRGKVDELQRVVALVNMASRADNENNEWLRAENVRLRADVQRGHEWQRRYADRLIEFQTENEQLRTKIKDG